MATIILILTILALYHYFVESYLLPIIRYGISRKLLILRDELILLKINNPNEISDHLFNELNSFVSILANNLNKLSIVEFVQIAKKSKNKELEVDKDADETYKEFTTHKIGEIKRIFEQTSKYSIKVVILNSAAWGLYLLPFILIALVLLIIFHGVSRLKRWLYSKRTQETILVMAEHELRCVEVTSNTPQNHFNKNNRTMYV